MNDELSMDDDIMRAALRAMLDDGIRELDAGLGVVMSPEGVMAEVFAELDIRTSRPRADEEPASRARLKRPPFELASLVGRIVAKPGGGSATPLPAVDAQEVDERLELRSAIRAACVVEEQSGKRRAPFLEHTDEALLREVLARAAHPDVRQPEAIESRRKHQVAIVELEPPRDGDLEVASAVGELPAIDRGCGRLAVVGALVLLEVAGVLRLAPGREVGRRAHDGDALVFTDPYRDHVAADRLAEVDSRVEGTANEVRGRRTLLGPALHRLIDRSLGGSRRIASSIGSGWLSRRTA